MAISINSAADARYYVSRMNSSKTNSSSAMKKSTSSIVLSMAKVASSVASTVKSVVKKNSSSATTTTKNNTNAAVNAASASIKSKTNQNKKTTTTVSSAASKVASSISKAVKTATNAVKTATQNTKASTNAKAAAASASKTSDTNTKNTSKNTNSSNVTSRIINTVNSVASTVKKATSNVNTSAAVERARQEAMAKAASARAKAEAKAKASAAAKTMASSVTVGAAATATLKNNKNTAISNKNTTKTTNTTVNLNVVKTASTTKNNASNNTITVTKQVKTTATYNNNLTKDKSVSNTTSSTPKSEACRTSLSMALTGKHSEGLERYLNTLEKQHGTSYVAENVFNGDINKYNPKERPFPLEVPIKAEKSPSKTSNSVDINNDYIYQSPDFDNNCCITSTEMLVSMNSDGRYDSVGTSNIYNAEDVLEINNTDELNKLEDEKKPKPVYTRKNTNYEDYDATKKGFYNLSGLTEKQLNDVIISEIDNGNVIMLHTQYAKNEHWVIVSSYHLDENGNIIYTTKPAYESRKYISGLGGVDPEEQHNDETPQKTDNLGEKATVDSSGGQWLNPDMTVRVFHP